MTTTRGDNHNRGELPLIAAHQLHLVKPVNLLAGFTALGEMAMALARVGAESVMGPLLPRVADQIKEAISVKGRTRPNCPEALQVLRESVCESMLLCAAR